VKEVQVESVLAQRRRRGGEKRQIRRGVGHAVPGHKPYWALGKRTKKRKKLKLLVNNEGECIKYLEKVQEEEKIISLGK